MKKQIAIAAALLVGGTGIAGAAHYRDSVSSERHCVVVADDSYHVSAAVARRFANLDYYDQVWVNPRTEQIVGYAAYEDSTVYVQANCAYAEKKK